MPVVLNGNALYKKEKDSSVAVQNPERKSLSGRRYKEWMRSLGKAKRSDPSKQKKSKLSHGEENVAEPNGSDEDKTTNADNSVSHSPPGRVDFLLRRVKSSSDVEKSNISNYATRTKNSVADERISESQCNEDMSKLQEKLAHSVADERKSTTANFVEYWVPVRLSNVQIEQYCGSLFSNSRILCSSSKFDPKDPLHEILVSTRKCCDHPYLLDSSIHKSLVQDIPQSEHFDAEIKLSGKLQLLLKFLMEISKQGLRVLILYQSLGGPGLISTRDILDDIIHENFGEDSFVRIDGRLSRSKRQEVLNTFNDKGSGMFACLMETRACVPSIKLKSVDTVIFFNSDWDPMNDLRALQKISLSSQFEHVKVFRLYSAHTVEEKLLMLAKQGMAPEGNIVNVKRSTCHWLLTWGAYYLFEKLDQFLNFSSSDKNSFFSYEDSFVEDVFLELSVLLPNNDESTVCAKNSFIVRLQQTEGVYSGNISLHGEIEYPRTGKFSQVEEMMAKEPLHVFWINLLQWRKPRWKYFSSRSLRTRKCVQRYDDLLKSVGASKKCRTEAKRRSLSELQNGDKERELPGEEADLTMRQAPMQGNTSSTDLYSLRSPTGRLVEDAVRRLESSVEHPTGEVPLQAAHIGSIMNGKREPSVPLTSLNGQPQEASHLTRSEVLQTVCKALQIELEGVQKQKTAFLKQHEDMKIQTKMECEKEIDEIRKKYEMVLQNAETAFVEETKVLETRYNGVSINKSLAEAMLQTDISVDATVSQGSVLRPRQHLQAGCQTKAPAPHHRHMVHSPLPFAAPTLPSQGPENVYSPVSLRPVTSSVQTRQSLDVHHHH